MVSVTVGTTKLVLSTSKFAQLDLYAGKFVLGKPLVITLK